jgi:magnesium-transporting ATPase (P-type)
MPLLIASFAALVLTVLLWPVGAIVRRRYKAPLALDAGSMSAYRWSRIGSVAIVAALCLWGLFVVLILNDTGSLGGRLDPLLILAQLLSVVAFWGGLALMLWNLAVVWRGQRRWPAKLWSIVLVIAALTTLWVGLELKLLHFGIQY